MLSRTTTARAAAAAAVTVVGVLAWFGTRPEARRRVRTVRKEVRPRSLLIRNVVRGRPIVAFAKIHGTVDVSGATRPVLYRCELDGVPHPSDAAIFAKGTTGGHFSNLSIRHYGFGFAAGRSSAPAGPDGDAPAGGDQPAEPAWEGPFRSAVADLWENRPEDMRRLPYDEQINLFTDLVVGAYRALRGDLGSRAEETAGPDVAPPTDDAERRLEEALDGWRPHPADSDGTPEV